MFLYIYLCLLFASLPFINATVIPGARVPNDYTFGYLLKRAFFFSETQNAGLEKRTNSPGYQKAIDVGSTFLAKCQSGPSPGEDTKFHIKDVTETILETNQFFDSWGWEDVGTRIGTPYADLQSALSANGLTGGFKWIGKTHGEVFNAAGDPKGVKDGEPTFAYFNALYNTARGVIVPEDNRTPRNADGSKKVYPQLENWSDVTYLTWAAEIGNDKSNNDKANKAKRKGLKFFYRYHISDESATHDIIKEAMGYDVTMNGDALAGKLAPWPASGTNIDGQTFSVAQDDRGKALLGTPHGKGVAWLLLQHQDPDKELGKKTVDTITLFQSDNSGKKEVNMLFTVKDL